MKKTKLLFTLMTLLTLVGGCSTLKEKFQSQNSSNVLTIKTNWVRSIVGQEYQKGKLIQTMKPFISEETLYQGNAVNGIVAMDRNTGHFLWKNIVKNGVNSGAVIYKGVLYYGASDGQFYAVKASSGKIVWTFPTQSENLTSPIIDGQSIYFQSRSGVLYSLDLTTGQMNWSYAQKDNSPLNIRNLSGPTIDANILYAGFGDGTLAALDKKTGNLKWDRSLTTPQSQFHDIMSNAVIDGELLYVGTYSGGLFAINKNTGEIIWRNDEGLTSQITVHLQNLYYSTSSKQVLSLDKKTGKTIWSYSIKSGVASQPIFFNEMIIFGSSDGPLEVLTASNGQYLGKFSTGWGVSAPISIFPSTNDIYVMSNYGNLYSLNLKWSKRLQKWPWEKK